MVLSAAEKLVEKREKVVKKFTMWAGIRARLCERDRKESGNWKYQRKLLINYCRTANGGRKLRILYFRSDTVWRKCLVGGWVEDGVCRLCIYMEETQFAAPPWSTYAASKWFSHFCVDSLLIQFSSSSSINEMVNQEVGARKCQKFIVNKSCCLPCPYMLDIFGAFKHSYNA